MYEVKKQVFADLEKTIEELPVVLKGSWQECIDFLKQFHFVRVVDMMFGGYYSDESGDCYYITFTPAK